jgi:hypothetical protein
MNDMKHPDPDPSLLALVTDDPLAPRILAWWKAKRPKIEDIPKLLPQMAKMAQAVSLAEAEATIERLQLAGLLLDGGIHQLGDMWLSSHISKQLGFKPQAPKKEK